MVLVHCTSPQCDLSVYEVTSSKTFEVMSRKRFRHGGTYGLTYRQTDVQTEGRTG